MIAKTIFHDSLIELAYALNQQNNFQEILRLVSEQACSLLGAGSVSLSMLNPQTRQTVKTIFREVENQDEKYFKSLTTQVSGWMIISQSAFISEDVKKDDRLRIPYPDKTDIRSIIGTRICVEGSTLGSLILLNSRSKPAFNTDDLKILEHLSVIAAPYLRNVQKINQFFESPIPEETLVIKYKDSGLIGKSDKFIEILQAIDAATRCDVRVMLVGETGTGKELIAKAIHKFSHRCQGPFVAIDCGAIPAHLLESELFGHVRGAFTGAISNRKGLFEEADKGILFMDEIANLPLDMQTKLMRVLQEGEIRSLGSNQIRKIDVRIICASSKPLRDLIDKGEFREDLYYRLHVYPILIPNLAARRNDIPLLASQILQHYAKKQDKKVSQFHEQVLEYMKNETWPGNIRELENFVERLVTLSSKTKITIDIESLPSDIKSQFEELNGHLEKQNIPLKIAMEKYEAEYLRDTLKRYNWNQSKAARSLSMSEQNLRYRMKKLSIQRP
jgi:transcriptional regulator with GAF, ATPase, and Fis domain